MLERASDIYLKPGSAKERVANPTAVLESKVAPLMLPSKIAKDVAVIQRLFDTKIASFKLVFRASENAFSIK